MTTGEGFVLNGEGKYIDIGDSEELEIFELEHSEYGLIKYVTYEGFHTYTEWEATEELKELPEDWMEEIE